MLHRLQRFLDFIKFDPSRATLGGWLVGINVTIVLLVVGGISISAIGLLRSLADQQGQVRVQLAGATAREDLRRYGEDALTEAKSLAARPTFQRLIAERRSETMDPYLRRACTTNSIVACAIFDGELPVARAGKEIPWNEVRTASAEQGERFLTIPTGADSPVLGAYAAVGNANLKLYIVRELDERMARSLSERAGVPIRLINYRKFTSAKVDPLTRLHSAGLSDGRSAVERVGDLGVYASSFPVFASTGEAIALLEARLSADDIDAAVDKLVRRLLITALVLSIVAVVAGVLLGQQVADPLSALTEASVRLGQGDFSTSIPVGGTAEVGKLARTMEDMRRNLVELTSTLRRSEAEAQAVLSGIVEGVYAVDKSRVIRYLNPQAARLLGTTPAEAIGKFCGDVLKPCAENGVRPCETRCPILQAQIGAAARATERLQTGAEGVRTTVITSATPVDGLQVQVIRDETELEGVRRARDSVLVNISHEFRTPLAAQLASIELLRDGLDTLPREQQRELVVSLERGTVRLTRLIDNLLESVRIESGQLSIRRQSVNVAELIEDADALISTLLAQRRQTLVVELPESFPLIEGDALRLTQVFVNLMTNASKFAPEATVIRIGGEVGEKSVTIWVEDEGPGVPGDGKSIFERFARGAEQEPEPGGLGLGLWIVKSIIDRHGGTIAAERTSHGRTRMVFTLPQAADAE
jgi:signal transduction histidine kinase